MVEELERQLEVLDTREEELLARRAAAEKRLAALLSAAEQAGVETEQPVDPEALGSTPWTPNSPLYQSGRGSGTARATGPQWRRARPAA